MERVDELAQRLDRVEAELASIRHEMQPSRPAAPRSWAPPTALRAGQLRAAWPAPAAPAPAVVPHRRPSEPLGLQTEHVLKWGGVGLVVLAIGFAVSTAISRGWIGREMQLAAALVTALCLVAAGVRLRSTRPAWMHALCTGGVIGAAITVASPLLRDLTNEATSVAATVTVVVASLLLAAGVKSEWVLAAATVSGAIGWSASHGGDPAEYASGIWLAVLLAAAVGLATAKRWFAARVLAWAVGGVAFVVAAATASGALDHWTVGLTAGAFVVGWGALAGTGSATTDWRQLELVLATVVAPWTLLETAVLFDIDDATPLGWTALALAGLFGAVAAAVRRRMSPERLVAMLIGSSVVTTIGLSALFDAAVAVVAVAVQGAGLVVLAARVEGGSALRLNGWVLLGASALALAGRLVAAWELDASVADDFAHVVAIAIFAGVAWKAAEREVRAVGGAAVLGLTMGWLGSVLVHLPQGQALVSISWAVVGTVLLIAGAARKLPVVAQAALGVFAVTSAKLLTVDLRQVDTLWRAGLFLIVGVVFLRLGFLLPRLTARSPVDDSARDRKPPVAQGPPLAA